MKPIKFNEDRTSVACSHCDAWIERGTEYAVLFYFPDDTEKGNPIGPYCRSCLEKVKVCHTCNKGFFGDDIEYKGLGVYMCKTCDVVTKEREHTFKVKEVIE